MQPLSKLLMAAALVLAIAGLVLAVGRPGDLGDDDATPTTEAEGEATTTTAPDERAGEATTTTAPDERAGAGDSRASTTTAAAGTPTTEAPASSGAGTPTTTTLAGGSADPAPADPTPVGTSGGSGLVAGDAGPRDLEDGLAATGGTSLLAGALALAAAGLLLPRRRV